MSNKQKRNLLPVLGVTLTAYKIFAEILKANNLSPEAVAGLISIALAVILLNMPSR